MIHTVAGFRDEGSSTPAARCRDRLAVRPELGAELNHTGLWTGSHWRRERVPNAGRTGRGLGADAQA